MFPATSMTGLGSLSLGRDFLKGGFQDEEMRSNYRPVPGQRSQPTRIASVARFLQEAPADAVREVQGMIQRGELSDPNQILSVLARQVAQIERQITSTTSNLPIRENLEAEAKDLTPRETPFRNMLARTPGSGLASAWRQLTSIGGGWDPALDQPGAVGFGIGTNALTGTTTTTITLPSTAGFFVGDVVTVQNLDGTGTETVTIASLTATVLTFTAAVANSHTASNYVAYKSPANVFFKETGAPSERRSYYASKTSSYKLLGSYGSVTGFAMASGANFQNQYSTERTNTIRNLLLIEENALINSSSTQVVPPYGDGTTALGFDGILNLDTTANGVPSAQIQTSVGALTFAHIDAQLRRLWNQGGSGFYILCNAQEALSIVHLATASGQVQMHRIITTSGPAGLFVTHYIHPITGDEVPIMVDRFMPAGTIVFGCERLPDGSPALDVDVLPQVELPALAPDQLVQGYTLQDIAPSQTAPQVYPFMVSVFETMRMKGAQVFAKSTGVTAV